MLDSSFFISVFEFYVVHCKHCTTAIEGFVCVSVNLQLEKCHSNSGGVLTFSLKLIAFGVVSLPCNWNVITAMA